MHRNRILILIAVSSVAIVMALPLYLRFIAHPGYESFLVSSVERDMQVLAGRIVKDHKFSAPIAQGTLLPKEFVENVEYIQRTFGLPKIKVFTADGIIVYSTDPADVGSHTSKAFFPQMLKDGLPRSELKIIKETIQKSEAQMIETYVPIIYQGVPVGAFELYRNITGLRQTFNHMKDHERKILFPVVLLLLIGGLASSFLAYRAMTELKRANDQFQQLSVTDALTGLLNRRGFKAAVSQQLSLLQRGSTAALLLYLDMDDFKPINDTFGHATGDQALVEAAGILKATFRTSDIIGRIGGDEFAVLAVQNQAANGAETIKGRLRESLALWNNQKKAAYTLSFSVGSAIYSPASPSSLDALMTSADTNMYLEKQQKKPA